MAKKWSEVTQSPNYQMLSDSDKEEARKQYFQSVVAPQIQDPNELVAAKAQFDSQYGDKRADFSGMTGNVQTPASKKKEFLIDPSIWFTGKPSDKSLFETIGDAIIPNKKTRDIIRFSDPANNDRIEFIDPLQHRLMDLPIGLAQSLGHGLEYGSEKLLGRDNGLTTSLRNDNIRSDAENIDREREYQERNPDSALSYGGATVGTIAPWLYGAPAKISGWLASKLAPKGSGLLRRVGAGSVQGGLMAATVPVTGEGGYAGQKGTQMAFGMGAGGLLPLSAAGVGGAYSGGKELFNMLARPDVVAQKNLARLYGSDQATINKLRSAQQYFPDEQITAAQALKTPESVMVEKAMRNRPEMRAAFENADNANNSGRMGILQGIAGTDDQLTGLLTKRRTEANTFANDVLAAGPENQRYLKASQIIEGAKGKRMSGADFDNLNQARLIMNRVHRGNITEADAVPLLKSLTFTNKTAQKTFEQAMTAVNKNMVNPANIVKKLEQLALDPNPTVSATATAQLAVIAKNADSTGKVPAFALDGVRQNIGATLSKNATNGITSSVESAKYATVSPKIISTLERTIPGYRDYLRTYRANSQPINTIEAARGILKPLNDRLFNSGGDKNLTNNDIAQGFRRDDKARYGMAPDARQALTGVQNSLQRRSISDSLRSPGSDTAYNLQADSWIGRNLLGPNLDGPTRMGYATTGLLGAAVGHTVAPGLAGSLGGSVLAGGLKKAADSINSRVASRTSVGVMDSRKAADMIEEFLKKNPQNRKQLLEAYPQWIQLIGGSSSRAITQQ